MVDVLTPSAWQFLRLMNYAAFYAIEAILLTKDLVFSKHSAVIGAFSQHFVKTAIFPKEFTRLISRLFRQRQLGDYEFELSPSIHKFDDEPVHSGLSAE